MKIIKVKIFGTPLSLKTDESEDYVRKLENFLNQKYEEILEKYKEIKFPQAIALLCLNIADELFKQNAITDTSRINDIFINKLNSFISLVEKGLKDIEKDK